MNNEKEQTLKHAVAEIDSIFFASKRQFMDRARQLYGNCYSYPTPYIGPQDPIIVHCNRHDIDFPVPHAYWHIHSSVPSRCPVCQQEEMERDLLREQLAETLNQIERKTNKRITLPTELRYCMNLRGEAS